MNRLQLFGLGAAIVLHWAPVNPAPLANGVYDRCSMVMGDGSTEGTNNLPCADVSSPVGIQIRDTDGLMTPVQNCDLRARTNVTQCFTYQVTGSETTGYNISYTVKNR